jgi:RNA polymerase sigma-70 factor (ECF subfamily)
VEASEQERWFNQEVHPHDGQLKAYLRSAFPAARDVEDVVQESYLRIWKAKARREITSAKAFLFQIARRLTLDSLRRDRRSPLDWGRDFASSGVLDSAPNAAQALVTNETLDHLADAIATLPPRWRQIIVLHKLHGIPRRDLAVQLSLSDRALEKQLYKGLRRCEAYLGERGIHGFFR